MDDKEDWKALTEPARGGVESAKETTPLGPSKILAAIDQLASVNSKSVHHSNPHGINQHHLMQTRISTKT